jgi:pimeloyl-ACP methyl ester carboxylesterase
MDPVVLPHTIHGSGPEPVVVLHGWFEGRTTFDSITSHLDGEAFTYAFVDLRGYGEARPIAGTYSMAEVARDVLAVADHLGWDRFSAIGHSMGGKAAQVLASLGAGRVRRIVGISPVSAGSVPFDAEAARLFARAVDDPSARRAILDWSTGGRLPARWVDEMVRRSLESVTREAFGGYLPRWTSEDFRERVIGCEVPALAIVGAHDPDLSAEAIRMTWMRTLPYAELVEIQDAGHYAMHETPLLLVSVIEEFLGRAKAD